MLRLCKEYISISLVWRVDATVMQGVHLHQFSLEGGCYGYARSLSDTVMADDSSLGIATQGATTV